MATEDNNVEFDRLEGLRAYIEGNYEKYGTVTRKAAEELRTFIVNIALSDKKKVVIDFAGVKLISSAYAYELIGKIISQYGFSFFISNFSIINLTSTNIPILNRSVQQRMAQSYAQ